MATYTPKKLAFIQLANAKGDVYDPGTAIGHVHNIILHNINTTDEVVVLNMHDGTNELELYKMTMVPNETIHLTYGGEGLIVDASSKITGNTTTAAKVTCSISGSERTT
jgi:hypothetical protein